MANATLSLGWEARSQDGKSIPTSPFYMHCKFPAYFLYTTGKSLCAVARAASPPRLGDCSERNIWKSKNPLVW